MTGTNKKQISSAILEEAQPVIVLVNPQMGENIGATARAMLNCGLCHLRLVNPRDGWPNERADAMAAGALDIMPDVAVFDSVADAVADCHTIYATTARARARSRHRPTNGLWCSRSRQSTHRTRTRTRRSTSPSRAA